ncbi:putative Retrovirus-related Pol polyprotein [Hypsibius exemplaris]|uniref:RNA-directed DNA polymerase n=1 Tax=Hypsibius exemplaris TaxID=2072580 RepID=A0A1W0WLC4_HYPEX|nr:putative Retrovirus-related Pol polyprotein [Hypsibius exemplaris]
MSVKEEELVQEIGESLEVFEMRKQLKKVKSIQKDEDEDESRDPQDQSIRPRPISPQVMPKQSLRRPATRDLSNDEDEDDQKSENIQALMNLLTGKSSTRSRRDRGPEGFEVPRQSRPPKELPTFRQDRGEDAVEFLKQFERVGSHHKWDDAEKLNYLFLALKGNAMDWHQSMSTRATWTEMRQAFLKAFGQQWVDMSLDEKTTHRLAREEPYSYTTRILRNSEHTHPGASEHDRVMQLMCQLPKSLKPHFVRRDPPKSVQEFTEDLQNAARIQCLHEESVLENGNLELLHAILQNPASEYSSALVKRFQASGSSAAPVLAAYEDSFPYDVLLWLDFLSETKFLLDFESLRLINPENQSEPSVALFLIQRLFSVDVSSRTHADTPVQITEIASFQDAVEPKNTESGAHQANASESLQFDWPVLKILSETEKRLASSYGSQGTDLITRLPVDDDVSFLMLAAMGSAVQKEEDSPERTGNPMIETAVTFGEFDEDDGLDDKDEIRKSYWLFADAHPRCFQDPTRSWATAPPAFITSILVTLSQCMIRRDDTARATLVNSNARWMNGLSLERSFRARALGARTLFLVPKKGPNGEKIWRPVLDMRKLNLVSKKDRFPMPNCQELLDSLHGAQWFTCLDLAQGYLQIPIAEEDREKTAFVLPGRRGIQLMFTRMIFGLTSAPATFCRLMHDLFKDVLLDFLLIYIDDLNVHSRTWEKHLKHLEIVLARLESVGLKLKPSKTAWGMTSVKFLGHRSAAPVCSPDPERVRAIEQYTTPTDLSAVRTFLGKVSYYRRLILGFSAIAKGLTILTEKDRPFVWEFEQAEAFRNLKKTMVSHPILQHFNPDLDCEIHTDASTKEVGAVLIQKNGDSEHVVAYVRKG